MTRQLASGGRRIRTASGVLRTGTTGYMTGSLLAEAIIIRTLPPFGSAMFLVEIEIRRRGVSDGRNARGRGLPLTSTRSHCYRLMGHRCRRRGCCERGRHSLGLV
jgi:hypothetical protein